MSARVYAEGNLGSTPELKYLQSGIPVLNLSVGATFSKLDKKTGQWVEDGDALWLDVPIWQDAAENVVNQGWERGDRVKVEGFLTVEAYQRRDGGTGTRLKLANASAAFVRKGQSAPNRSQTPAGGGYSAPAMGVPADGHLPPF